MYFDRCIDYFFAYLIFIHDVFLFEVLGEESHAKAQSYDVVCFVIALRLRGLSAAGVRPTQVINL